MPQEHHPSSSPANDARPRPYVISCSRIDLGPYEPDENTRKLLLGYPYDDYHGPTYLQFVHEADVRLMELRIAIDHDEMTVEEAYDAFRPYAHLSPEMYTPEFQEECIDGFPGEDVDGGMTLVSEKLWREASALNIPGVGIDLSSPSPGSGYVFAVFGDEAFEKLQSRLRNKYIFEVTQV